MWFDVQNWTLEEGTMQRRITCFCNDVQTVVRGKPVGYSFCHCSICRSITGAPFSANVLFKASTYNNIFTFFFFFLCTAEQWGCNGNALSLHIVVHLHDVPFVIFFSYQKKLGFWGTSIFLIFSLSSSSDSLCSQLKWLLVLAKQLVETVKQTLLKQQEVSAFISITNWFHPSLLRSN